MNEDMELIKHIYKDSEMASYTIEALLKDLENKDNKITKYVQELLNEYQEFLLESKSILESENEEIPKNSTMSKMGAKMGIDKDVKDDNSDSSIADLLIRGISMGSIDIEKKINDYKDISDKKFLKLAKNFLNFQKNSIEKLKKYL